jgi:capsular polysaccharide biosynthesis protein
VGLAFLLEYLDDYWRSPREVEQVSGVPTLGIVPEFKVAKSVKRKGR